MKLYSVMLNTGTYYHNVTEQFIKDNKDNIKKVFLQTEEGKLVEVHNY